MSDICRAPVYIIAEIGVNHNGDPKVAMDMIAAAKDTGADCVKFQTFSADALADRSAPLAAYQNDGKLASQYELLKSLELPHDAYDSLVNKCAELEIDFLSSPFDIESLLFLSKLGLTRIKLGSGEITNYPILKRAAELSDELILSTGMATLAEIDEAVVLVKSNSLNGCELSLLHCNSSYPTPENDVNLRAIETLQKRYGLRTGFSDHTKGGLASLAAVAAGAKVIEKHFTLDCGQDGPDHSASMEPSDFKKMVSDIRCIEKMLGSGGKVPTESELPNRDVVRKSVVAAQDIKEGQILREEDLTTLRPGTGVSPMAWPTLVGKPSPKSFKKGEFLAR